MKLAEKSDNSSGPAVVSDLIDFLHHVSEPHCSLDEHLTDLKKDVIVSVRLRVWFLD